MGKFLNCGQTCIAPDYILVHKKIKSNLIEALIREIEKSYGKNQKNQMTTVVLLIKCTLKILNSPSKASK